MANFSGWQFQHGLTATSVALGMVLASTTLSRAVEFWNGSASTDWFSVGNWSAIVPDNTTSTRIDTVTPNATVVGAAGAQSTGLRVGVSATGALTIQTGGTVNNTLGIIGDNAGSTGTAIVDGAGSSWTNSSDFYVGHNGNGTLTVSNGGAVGNVVGFVGRYSTSTSTATVDGGGSTWTNSSDLIVGYAGNGTLNIRNGGKVSSDWGFVALDPGSTGAATVDGAGSAWTTAGDFFLGYDGNGTLTVRNSGTLSNVTGYIGLSFTSTSTATVDGVGSTWTNGGNLYVGYFGAGTLTIRNGGAVSASALSIANKTGSTGTLNIGAAAGQAAAAPGTLYTVSVDFGNGTGQIVFNHTAANYIFAPAITSSGTGTGTVRVEAGTTILTATNTYTGATVIDGGTLSVNGSIAQSAVTVNAGGTLGGNGTVGDTTLNGGKLAPGNSIGLLTVNGSLAFTAASSYMVEISSTNADRVNVTGTAALSGATVNLSFVSTGSAAVAKQYTIVNATGGISGTFGALVSSNLPTAFKPTLSYDGNNAYLNLALSFSPANTDLNGNQTNVANSLANYFNRNGSIPSVYGALTPAGLTQASGPIATAVHPTMMMAAAQFMTAMTDVSAADRLGPSSAMAFAEEGDVMNAYAEIRLRGTGGAFEPRWRTWASAFGGGQITDGNAVTGSSTTTSRIFGVAAGADYRLSPATVAGFALAGGGTGFNVASGGSGRTDLFQAGAFIKHTAGSAYVSAAAAYGWHDVTTDRTVTIQGIGQLRARFVADTFAGRVEGGNRYVAPWVGGLGLTPYAAAQVTLTRLPAYAETVVSGTNAFALSYQAKDATAPRTELGLRSDKSFAVNDALLTLRGRVAWAHDFNPLTAASATFQALPGASFVVNGAAGAHDAVLTTAAAELKWLNGFALAATFEGGFSAVTRSYAGKSVASYRW
ncbi:autotransporter outer membrane beta-barrel domain-containing protein [Bradyrhizobium sp. AZCC 1693]|uniref:autotransporter outer membrane beta-barrel domain-containing protein n=1 Tax=Bradyrhizobium sp. AZCC 1693 TaxID=3117029 RepID=UPI002FF1C40B